MSLEDVKKLKVGDTLDHRDNVGMFAYGKVIEKYGNNLKIHYVGWESRCDAWVDITKENHRFAKAHSISRRPANRLTDLKKGNNVDINPTQTHPGWKGGAMRGLDKKSGQVQIVYEYGDKNHSYWAHLDDKSEIAEFRSMVDTEL